MVKGKDVILMISANDAFVDSLKKVFDENGYEVTIAATGSSSVGTSQHRQPAIILVDRVSTNPATLRQFSTFSTVPILSFCPPGMNYTEDDCVTDLDMGVDASVCNEGARQLLARTRAILRRLRYASSQVRHYEAGEIQVDLERHEVSVRAKNVFFLQAGCQKDRIKHYKSRP